LGAVAGDIAYAIVPILACCLFYARPVYFTCLRNGFPRRKAWGLASNRCRSAPDLIWGQYEIRAGLKLFRGVLGIFLERSQE
jgi:hypothetical protein